MQSLKSRLIIGLIRNRHLFQGKLKRETVDESFSVGDFRRKIDKASVRARLPKDVSFKKFTISGRNAEWINPENSMDGKVLLYIHGGGFISGSCVTHRMHVPKFAKTCGLKALLFDYRLAPEHPFPAAIDDCLEAWDYLISQGYKPNDIVIGGESAGGTLTLSLLLALKDRKSDMPLCAFSISPVTDLSCKADSFIKNAKNDIAPFNSWNIWTQMYIGATDIKNPILSPAFGDFTNCPPIHICVGTYEIHLDDCMQMYEMLKSQQVETDIQVADKMIHAFPVLAPLFPEATIALNNIGSFVKKHL